jgi:RNA polymerase sigma-70 factor (ECF subfamily)
MNEPNRQVPALIDMELSVTMEAPAFGELVAAARRGDRDAFTYLVSPHLETALRVARVVAGSPDDGTDAVQDALLSAWQGIGSLREPAAFPAWFRRHVTRSAIKHAKRRGRVVELDIDTAAPADALDRAFAVRELDRAFDRLSVDDRTILTLRHLWDLPGAEIAQHLGIPEGTVKSRVHAAMNRLRAAYEAEERR